MFRLPRPNPLVVKASGHQLDPCCTVGMDSRAARYDGNASWYDTTFAAYADVDGWGGLVRELLGPAPGQGVLCLEVGSGTSLHAASISAAGYVPLGLDLSADQLRVAQVRTSALVRGDAARLPFLSSTFSRVISVFTHTDMDDFTSVVAEAARVLKAGGRFVYIGLHPCFVGSFADRAAEVESQTLFLRPGYGDPEVRVDTTGRFALRSRVGGNNLSLGGFLHAFLDAPGLSLRSVRELDTGGSSWSSTGEENERLVPWNVAVVAEKSAGSTHQR